MRGTYELGRRDEQRGEERRGEERRKEEKECVGSEKQGPNSYWLGKNSSDNMYKMETFQKTYT